MKFVALICEFTVFCRSMNVHSAPEDFVLNVICLFTKHYTCVPDVLLRHQVLTLAMDNSNTVHN